jgi:hypothetical protein
MIIEHCYHSTSREWIEEALNRVPQKIRLLLSQVRIFAFRSDASVNGLVPRDRFLRDGRRSCHYAHFNPEMNAVFLFQRDLFVAPEEHNMLFHEIGHALDWVLGGGGYLSTTLDCGEPLDKHAARNPQEQFAQAFEGWMRGDRIVPKGDFAHTASEVKEKAPVLFELFERLAG